MATWITHDLGEQFLARGRFYPLGAQLFTVVAANAAYTQASKTLTMTGEFTAADVEVGGKLYIVGGDATRNVTAGIYEIATRPNDNSVTLTTDAQPAGNVATGVVVLQAWRMCIALDARTVISESDTIAAVEAYEEDGTDYRRQLVDPLNSASWTIDQDAESGDYQATSAQVTFTAGAADWQANRNAALIAFTGAYVAAPSTALANEILIASLQFDNSVTLGNGESHPFKFRLRFSEAA